MTLKIATTARKRNT